MDCTYQNLKNGTISQMRAAIRSGAYRSHTAGLGRGYLQANLVIMPKDFALDFIRFCQRNPKPCPVTAISDTGNPMMFTLGRDIDIRTDLPAYNIYQDGCLDRDCSDILDIWRKDLVAFALGCSFTFEHALIQTGIPIWHIDNNKTVPMFRSNIDTVPAGPFKGKMVVSMRAMPKERVQDAIDISRHFPLAHGAPVHWGNPKDIGIDDLNAPDWGDIAPLPKGFLPVFWACGVTPQVAIETAKLPLCITHKPGHMLITDISENAEIPIYKKSNHINRLQQGDQK